MPSAELSRRSGVAIRLALTDGEDGHDQLERYLEEMDDAAVERLWEAARNLGDTASFVMGRRHS